MEDNKINFGGFPKLLIATKHKKILNFSGKIDKVDLSNIKILNINDILNVKK